MHTGYVLVGYVSRYSFGEIIPFLSSKSDNIKLIHREYEPMHAIDTIVEELTWDKGKFASDGHGMIPFLDKALELAYLSGKRTTHIDVGTHAKEMQEIILSIGGR